MEYRVTKTSLSCVREESWLSESWVMSSLLMLPLTRRTFLTPNCWLYGTFQICFYQETLKHLDMTNCCICISFWRKVDLSPGYLKCLWPCVRYSVPLSQDWFDFCFPWINKVQLPVQIDCAKSLSVPSYQEPNQLCVNMHRASVNKGTHSSSLLQ